VIEIDVDAFRAVVLSDPAIVEKVTAAVALRREELERHRTTRATAAESRELAHTFLARVRQFLRLSAS
jgi:CRP-like cAMP-binding protein